MIQICTKNKTERTEDSTGSDKVIPSCLTYRKLLEQAKLHHSFSNQLTWNNARSELVRWCRGCGKQLDDKIGAEFDDLSEDQSFQYLEQVGLVKGGKSFGSVVSRIKLIHVIYKEFSPYPSERTWPQKITFAEALKSAIKNKKILSIRSLARDCVIPLYTLHDWLRKQSHPKPEYIPKIRQIEDKLGLLQNSLTTFVYTGPVTYIPEPGISERGKHRKDAIKLHYRIYPKDWPTQMLEEWKRYLRYKTGNLLRGQSNRRPNSGWCTKRPGRGSENNELNFIASFFGFLCSSEALAEVSGNCPPGLPLKPDQLSFALFMVEPYLRQFVLFRMKRSFNGDFKGERIRILESAIAMTHEEYGFFARPVISEQNQMEAIRMFQSATKDVVPTVWRDFLQFAAGKIRLLLKQSSSHLTQQQEWDLEHDGEEEVPPIDDAGVGQILALESPAEVLYNFEKQIWRQPIPETWLEIDQAVEFTQRLFVSLQIYAVMRVATWERTLVSDFAKKGTCYELTLPYQRFKNRAYLKKVSYQLMLPPIITPLLDAYLHHYRPIIQNHCQLDDYFFPAQIPKPGRPMRRQKFEWYYSLSFKSMTQFYLGKLSPAGFTPHAVRHIMATTCIVRDPVNGWKQAAAVLWENEKTVRAHYVHLINKILAQGHSGHANDAGYFYINRAASQQPGSVSLISSTPKGSMCSLYP